MSKRKIVIDEKTYHWTYGGDGPAVATIWDGNKKYCISSIDMLGIDNHAHERGQWKETTDGMVTPRFIRAWIERKLLGRDVPIPQHPYNPPAWLVEETKQMREKQKGPNVEIPIGYVQPEVYLIYRSYYNDDAGRIFASVVEATLDPAFAKQIADDKNNARTEEDIDRDISFYARFMKLEYRKILVPSKHAKAPAGLYDEISDGC
jgi:hypothetical protein